MNGTIVNQKERKKMNFKKMAILCLFILGMTFLLAGCGGEKQNSAVNEIKKKGKIVVGTASGYFPFEMADKQGNLIGYDIDLSKAIGKELGVEVEFQNYAFSGLIPALQANKVDIVVGGMTILDKRKEVVDFTDPYFVTGNCLLVSKKYPDVKSWQDLDKPGNVIAVSMGTTGEQTASTMFKQATVKKFEGASLAGLEVINGNAAAVVHEVPWVAIYSRMNAETTYPVLEAFTTENLGIAVPKGNEDLVKYLNEFLKKRAQSGEAEKSKQYWFVDMPWYGNVEIKKK